jgi:hypothetical protein
MLSDPNSNPFRKRKPNDIFPSPPTSWQHASCLGRYSRRHPGQHAPQWPLLPRRRHATLSAPPPKPLVPSSLPSTHQRHHISGPRPAVPNLRAHPLGAQMAIADEPHFIEGVSLCREQSYCMVVKVFFVISMVVKVWREASSQTLFNSGESVGWQKGERMPTMCSPTCLQGVRMCSPWVDCSVADFFIESSGWLINGGNEYKRKGFKCQTWNANGPNEG